MELFSRITFSVGSHLVIVLALLNIGTLRVIVTVAVPLPWVTTTVFQKLFFFVVAIIRWRKRFVSAYPDLLIAKFYSVVMRTNCLVIRIHNTYCLQVLCFCGDVVRMYIYYIYASTLFIFTLCYQQVGDEGFHANVRSRASFIAF